MRIVILDSKTLGDVDLTVFEQFGDVEIYETTPPDKTAERIAEMDIVITNKVVLDDSVLKHARNLKLICVAATGMNNIDLASALNYHIEVKNVSGYSTKSVAQHTFTMLFHLLGQVSYYDRITKDGTWTESGIFTNIDRPFFELTGKRWGIIGLGTIGKEVARLANAFGCRVRFCSTSGTNIHPHYPKLSLETLLYTSEVISIHAPLNQDTRNLITYSKLKLIKEGSILINVGRGGIIDESALARLLDEKAVYAGLDVLEKEPICTDHPLTRLKHPERLLLTPHIAWSSREARQKLITGIEKNIQEFIVQNVDVYLDALDAASERTG